MTAPLGLNPTAGSAAASGVATVAQPGRRVSSTPDKVNALVAEAEAAANPAPADPSKFPPEIPDFPIHPLDPDTGRGIRAYQVAQARANAGAVTLGLSQHA